MEPVCRGTLGRVLFALSAVTLIAMSAASGCVLHRPEPSGLTPPVVTSVDAGFARDMATHHEQAISMAGYVRDHSTDPAISLWGFDIERSQNFQVGQLSGWLQAWELSRTSDLPPMSWMASWMPMSGHTHSAANGMMPGMATPDEMTKLQSLTGKALDIDFLQLMIRHHQGGVQMATYAAEHATLAYVRDTAKAMASGQSAEIIDMERDLRVRGGVPLPFTM